MKKSERTRAIVLTPGLIARFWAKVDQAAGADGCWPWIGKVKNVGGYGVLHRGGAKADTLYAHRLSFQIANDRDPIGFAVCHRCDNPPCVNPDHLFLGTIADNVADMIAKGRASKPPPPPRLRGEQVGGSKLRENDVRSIRRQAKVGASSRQLGKAFGVDDSTVRQIVRRKIWRHLDCGEGQ